MSYCTFSKCLPFFHHCYFGWEDDPVPAPEGPPCGNGGNSAHIDGLHAPKLQEVQIADRRMMRFELLQKGVYYDLSFGDTGGPRKEARAKRPREELGLAPVQDSQWHTVLADFDEE